MPVLVLTVKIFDITLSKSPEVWPELVHLLSTCCLPKADAASLRL